MALIDPYLTTTQQVTLKHRSAVDANGQATYSSTTERARVDERLRLVRTSDSETLQSVAVVLLRPGATVEVDDRITYGGQEWPVIAVYSAPGLNGSTLHKIAYLGA